MALLCLTEFTGAFCHGLGTGSRRHSQGAPQGRRCREFPYPLTARRYPIAFRTCSSRVFMW